MAWSHGDTLAAVFLVQIVVFCAGQEIVDSGSLAAPTHHVPFLLRASWPSTPLLLEASEFLGDADNAKFWRFAETVGIMLNLSDQEQFFAMIKTAAPLLSPLGRDILKFSIDLRDRSPRVELHRQLAQSVLHTLQEDRNRGVRDAAHRANDSAAWTLFKGQVFLSAAALTNAFHEPQRVLHSQPEVYEFDHIYPAKSLVPSMNPPTAILHAQIGTHAFWDFHQVLAAEADKGNIRYVYRHFLNYHNHTLGLGAVGSCRALNRPRDESGLDSLVQPLGLRGFGAEMSVKSSEYHAEDDQQDVVTYGDAHQTENTWESWDTEVAGFRFNTLVARKPHLISNLYAFKESLLSSMEVADSIKAWEFRDIGFQATHRIMKAHDPLAMLQEVNHNFPTFAGPLSRLVVDENITNEILENQKFFPMGRNQFLVNGRPLDLETVTPFHLARVLEEEVALIDILQALGLPAPSVMKLVQLPVMSRTFRVDTRDPAVVFLNDIESDARYDWWPPAVNKLNQPFTGIPFIRKNLYTLVLFVDVGNVDHLHVIEMLALHFRKNAPVNMGIVLYSDPQGVLEKGGGGEDDGSVTPTEDRDKLSDLCADILPLFPRIRPSSEAFPRTNDTNQVPHHPDSIPESSLTLSFGERLTRLFYGVVNRFTPEIAFTLLEHVAVQLNSPLASQRRSSLTMEQLCAQYKHVLMHYQKIGVEEDAKRMMQSDTYDEQIHAARRFRRRMGVPSLPAAFVNGLPVDWHRVLNVHSFIQMVLEEVPSLQSLVTRGEINDGTDVYSYLLSQPTVFPRFHPLIFPSEGVLARFVPLTVIEPRVSPPIRDWAEWKIWWTDLTLEEKTQRIRSQLTYFHTTTNTVRPITHWIVVDMSSGSGLLQLYELLQRMEAPGAENVRMAIVHNPIFDPVSMTTHQDFTVFDERMLVERLVHHLWLHSGQTHAMHLLSRICFCMRSEFTRQGSTDFDADDVRAHGEATIQELLKNMGVGREVFDSFRTTSANIVDLYRHIAEQRSWALEVLGVRPGASALVTNGRIVLLEKDAVFTLDDMKLLETVELKRSREVINEVGAALGKSRYNWTKKSEVLLTVISQLTQMEDNGIYRTPLTTALKSKHSAIRSTRLDPRKAYIDIDAVLDPLSTAAQRVVPLFVALRDRASLHLTIFMNPSRECGSHPLKRYYRFVIDSITFDSHGCLVEGSPTVISQLPQHEHYTLNLEVPRSWVVEPVQATFDPENIHLDQLTTDKMSPIVYELKKLLVEGQIASTIDFNVGVTLSTHRGRVDDTLIINSGKYFQLHAPPGVWSVGMGEKGLRLIPDTDTANDRSVRRRARDGSVLIDVSSFTGREVSLRVEERGGRSTLTSTEEALDTDVIHVFSVASGHMYERLLRTMMLSARRNTSGKLKFWLLGNFLSPRMRDLLPIMANAFGIDVETVTYNWPPWLHRQTDKIRIIWGYKILFLDVLFPQDIQKVIFIDADQVIRSDLRDLWNVDLKGSLFGFTAFCKDRREMDGFRFWSRGFWQTHLAGKPYHISALFVADLKRLRSTGGMERLRRFYKNLSRDPQNLANLDQDLFNYAQHVVPIHTLPSEWLWCETWCSDEAKEKARTIDLCNNPQTKETKLQAARRIIPEWSHLDEEIRALETRFNDLRRREQCCDLSRRVLRYLTQWTPALGSSSIY